MRDQAEAITVQNSSGSWGPPTQQPSTGRAKVPDATQPAGQPGPAAREAKQPKVWSSRRRGVALGIGAAAICGAFALAVTTPGNSPMSAEGQPFVPVTAPPTTAVQVLAAAPPTAQAAVTVALAPVGPTGSAQACPELYALTGPDGDSWGECAPDLAGSLTRGQAMVKFLGYTELTCVTDPVTAATTCDALAPDGAVRTIVIELTGVVTRNEVTQAAPGATASP